MPDPEDLLPGRIKLHVPGRSYGFIAPDDGSKDVFFHDSVVVEGVDLSAGSPVRYRLQEATRIPQAERVETSGAAAG